MIMRFFGYTLGDESVPTPPPRPELFEEMGKFIEEMTNAGVFITGGAFAPTADGKKVTLSKGKFTVTDGPFAEAKELIGGWAILEAKDMDEALEVTKRFLSVVGDGESRIRPIFE
jgi:hypothetical protein